jgi:hypothetical protein
MTLLLEIEDAVVILQGEGDMLTREEMVAIAGSLGPDREVMAALTKRGRGRFSQFLINSLGPAFGPLYEPGYVPKGFVPQGGPYTVPTSMDAESGGRLVLNNSVVQQYSTRYCYLSLLQHRRGSSAGPSIARRAIEYPSETVVKVTEQGSFVYPGYRAEYAPAHGVELYVSGPYLMTTRRATIPLRSTGSSVEGPGSTSRRWRGRAATR